jgi:hypothetical protein
MSAYPRSPCVSLLKTVIEVLPWKQQRISVFASTHDTNNSEFLYLPPHTTHQLQPLDCNLLRPLQIFLQEDVIAFNHHHPNKSITEPYFGKGFTSLWNRKRRLKNGKREIFQKSELEATWRTLFQVDFSKVEKKRECRYSWRCSCWVLWTNIRPMSQQ